jgi:YopJ family protease
VTQEIVAFHPTGPKENPDDIQNYLKMVTKRLDSGKVAPFSPLSDELNIMPLYVEAENKRNPGQDLYFAKNPELFCEMVTQFVADGVSHARFIVNLDSKRVHFAAFDYSLVGKQASVIGIEPFQLAPVSNKLKQTSADHLHQQISKNFLEITAREGSTAKIRYALIEAQLQNSEQECGIFSLSFAGKMYKEQAALARLHNDNRAGKLPSVISASAATDYLPISFFKHAQSPRKVEEFLKKHPAASQQEVNKKGETLKSRQTRFMSSFTSSSRNAITFSVSAHRKRETYLQRANNLIHQYGAISDARDVHGLEHFEGVKNYLTNLGTQIGRKLFDIQRLNRSADAKTQDCTRELALLESVKKEMQALQEQLKEIAKTMDKSPQEASRVDIASLSARFNSLVNQGNRIKAEISKVTDATPDVPAFTAKPAASIAQKNEQ